MNFAPIAAHVFEELGPVGLVIITAVIAGLVQVAKKVKNRDPLAWEMVLSTALGVILAGGWYITQAMQEVSPLPLSEWFAGFFYGAMIGLSVSGVVDLWKKETRRTSDNIKAMIEKM